MLEKYNKTTHVEIKKYFFVKNLNLKILLLL